MNYAKIQNGQVVRYPYGLAELKADNPYTNYGDNPDVWSLFPATEQATLHGCKLVKVHTVAAPTFDPQSQKIVYADRPTEVNGEWVLVPTVETKTESETAAENQMMAERVRAERNRRLAECDWTQLADAPANSLAWSNYRQQLRDLTTQPGFPHVVVWPNTP